MVRQFILGCTNFVAEATGLVSHWVFAMKYWSIACRLELIQKNENSEKLNARFTWLNVFGILFNLLAALGVAFIGNPENPRIFKLI